MQIATTRGPMDVERLERIVGFEDRPNDGALWVEFRIKGDESRELVRRDAFRIQKQTGAEIPTTLGLMPREALTRAVELEDNPGEMVVAEVFKLAGEVVHRSAHVVLKQAGVEAEGVAAAIG